MPQEAGETIAPGLQLQQHTETHLGVEAAQGVAVLAMNSWELGEHIRNAAESNPFLTLDEQVPHKHPCNDTKQQHTSVERLLARLAGGAHQGSGGSFGEIRRHYPFEQHLVGTPSMQETLLSEVSLLTTSARQAALCEFLVGNINSSGYLCVSLEEAARVCKATTNQALCALKIIWQAAPAGVGARTLSECLVLQLRAHQSAAPQASLAERIAKNYLPDLAKNNYQSIASSCNVPTQDVHEAAKLLRSLNPRPALLEGAAEKQPAVWPEVELIAAANGGWRVRPITYALPQLALDSTYLKLLNQQQKSAELGGYLKTQHRKATSLLTAVERRQHTIVAVSEAIIKAQHGFIEGGLAALVPLTQAQVAAQAGVSESTVSRVAGITWIQTAHGLISLRSFFSQGVGQSSNYHSSRIIKMRLGELVAAEDKRAPLSDKALGEQLAARWGITVARRTIAKYRDSLGILCQSARRSG